MDGGEALEDRDEAPVLALGGIDVDDVVVEVVVAGGGRDGEEFGAGRMDEDRLEAADLGSDVDRHG